ncbi:CmcJ/NvfI family oxidoreductase [Paraburkholderia sp. CNPSo 3281]|uniref:CmcJ/NvfI family oxidoreductase n=1 Tax=Paraburkholderia sp. CNPSo 3281 TaxID=2940933 RepID=UPI0020B68DB3|nr:CmcJ/NvfI family oxidoreductase [Paraburkholderia sp. CNPSo 3281]MCP3717382.1 methyltransferase [Paraburkholderia sp. CNPSo 3281]
MNTVDEAGHDFEVGELQADINYLEPGGVRPVSYMFDPPRDAPRPMLVLTPRRMRIRDARPLAEAGALGLDVTGFELVAYRTVLSDFGDDDAIRSIYHAEVKALLRAATGADKVVIFDHTLRDSARDERGSIALRGPVLRAHVDQTPASALRRVAEHVPSGEVAALASKRFAIINVWRPLEVVECMPLAVCDARSIAPDDLVASDLIYPDRVGETYLVNWNAGHRWYYFPQMHPGEALLLKIHDSLMSGTARHTPHTAFDDPTTPRAAASRRSIEVRALVFWTDGVESC